MTEVPRPQSIYRVQSTDTRAGIYPIQSAQSSLSSFTSYFGASTIDADDNVKSNEQPLKDDPVPNITKGFAPYVPVVASDDANELCRRKGFASLFDLLRSFGDCIDSKIPYRDTNGQTNNLVNFNLNFMEMGPSSNMVNYGQADIQRPGLVPSSSIYSPGGDLVALERQIENEMQLAGENIAEMAGPAENAGEKTNSSAYYDSFLVSLLAGLPTSPHETFSHPVASCIAITSHNDSPIETLVALYKGSSDHIPTYIDPGFLRYYILIHDEDEHDLDKSLTLFSRMKNSFGIHCYLLRLTSRTVSRDDDAVLEVPTFERRSAPERLRSRWHAGRVSSQFLATAKEEDDIRGNKVRYIPYVDHTCLTSMVREMVTQSIVPYMERCISLWNDQIAAPRRGLAGRFFKAGRSLWGSSRAATPIHGNGNYDPSTSSYPPNSAEAQLRKLADFAFMLRDWKLANSIYDMLRKDFSNDKAWKYHAGAQEMFVVTQLLLPAPVTSKMRADTIEPTLDSALYGYLSRCSAPFSALRAMLLTAELLRIRPNGAKDDAAKWIMRIMESNLVGEMTRALLVERTAYCFSTGEHVSGLGENGDTATAIHRRAGMNYTGSRRRKAAFWSVLAAEHWSTIGKFRLARQALKEALQVYGNCQWIAIQGTLSLLKTESGLVDGYQLTPEATGEEEGQISMREAGDRVKQEAERKDAAAAPTTATTHDIQDGEDEHEVAEDEEDDTEDETITIPPHVQVSDPASQTASRAASVDGRAEDRGKEKEEEEEEEEEEQEGGMSDDPLGA